MPDVAVSGDLSAREVQVIEHLAAGRTNKQIGELLGISPLTVKVHIARIGARLGLTGSGRDPHLRSSIVVECYRRGLIQ